MTLDPAKNHFDGPVQVPGVDGYHVNATALGWASADLSAFQVFPENHKQEFAGGGTFFLRWDDEAHARKYIPAEFWHADEDTP